MDAFLLRIHDVYWTFRLMMTIQFVITGAAIGAFLALVR
jgi:hypothetical protein